MNLWENDKYLEDLKRVSELDLPWRKLKGRSVLVSGASGMIGSFLIDLLVMKNRSSELNCKILALGRNEKRARKRFAYCFEDDCFHFTTRDVNLPLQIDIDKIDYVFHLASNTHPVAYATDPIGTIMSNVIGTQNLLDFAVEHCADRVLFASSVEIYGENRGDVEKFDEDYCGYINCNTLRAGYPEGKRCGESLCQAYAKQKGLDIIIPRFARVYGPTMLMTDTKAISQFILKGVQGENIVLKSEGRQYYSFTYVSDAVSGLLAVFFNGKSGEAYNIADESGDIMLKDLAMLVAEKAGTKVVFDLPDAVENAGFSKATRARLEGKKIRQLGWSADKGISDGVDRTLKIIRECCGNGQC